MKIKSEAKFTFWEATSIIVGHGVGSGILAVPYLVSRNSWPSFLLVVVVAYLFNLLLHLMIAELSLNNGGAQFIKCFENELFKGKIGKYLSLIAFVILGFSVLINVSGFISGGGAVFTAWFGLPIWLSQILYYVIASSVVYMGMKAVGIGEKVSVFSMVAVIGILLIATLTKTKNPLPSNSFIPSNAAAMYSMVAFSLSAVMSVPQVVKGLNGERKGIVSSIALGTGLNVALMLVVTFMTLIGVGSSISGDGALVDLSKTLGGWVGIIGYIFSLLALSTSFWANTLNLRDIVSEKTSWNVKLCWFLASFPCLVIALSGVQGFVGFTRIAGIVQVLTGIGVIVAYNRSRKKLGSSALCGRWGTLPFQILVVGSSLLATLGSLLKVV